MSTTTILELGRINSVRVKAEGEDADNKNNWINTFPPIHLKKGSEVFLDSSIINVRGADSNAIQFDGGQASNNNPIDDNTCEFELGFYLNNIGMNSVGFPFIYVGQVNGGFNQLQKFLTDSHQDSGQDTDRTDLTYLMAENREYMNTTSNPSDEYWSQVRDVKTLNPYFGLDGRKYAKIDRSYTGWARQYIQNEQGVYIPAPKTDLPNLMRSRVPIEFDAGFTAPSSMADYMTLAFQQTNQDITSEDLTAVSFHYFKQDANQALNPEIPQPRLNGFCFKSIEANMVTYGSNTNHIYGNLCVDNPYLWKYGCQILSNAETYDLHGYDWFNPNFSQNNTANDNIRIAYPCLVWVTNIGDGYNKNLQDYSLYSPHREEIVAGAGDNSIITLSGLTGDLEFYNDVYRNVFVNTNNGGYLYKSGSDFLILRNAQQVIGGVRPVLCVDNTDPNYSLFIGWNRFNSIGGQFYRVIEQLVRDDIADGNEWNNKLSFSPAGSQNNGDISYLQNHPFQADGFRVAYTAAAGVYGDVYVYDWLVDPIVEGEKYTLSFTTTGYGATGSGPYAHPIIVADRTAAFGMAAMNITTDGDHSQTFTATGSYSGSNALMIGYRKQLPAGLEVNVSNLSFTRHDTETDETYTIRDENNAGGGGFLDTTNLNKNKMYSITQNQSIGTYALTLANNTIPAQGAYVGVDYNRSWKVIRKGALLSYTGTEFQCITTLNGHDPNVALLYDDSDPDYTYWCFQGFSSTTNWTMYRLSKYLGGIPQAGDSIGTIQSVGFNVKQTNRNGQQYYDFSAGNTWSGSTKNVLKTIPNPFDTTSTFTFDPAGADVHYTYYADDGFEFEYLAPQTQTWKYVQSILTETIQANETFTISFDITNVSNPGNPLSQPFRIVTSYLEGAVNYNPRDFTTEGNHTFSFTTTQAPFNQSTAIYWGFYNNHPNSGDVVRISNFRIDREENVSITSSVVNPLPTINTGGVAGVVSYFAQVDIHVSYGPNTLGIFFATEENPNDNDKEGKNGRIFWQDTGNWYAGTWSWNSATTITLSIDGGINLVATGGTPTLTNVFEYPTSQTISTGGQSYAVPTDGRMYGSGYGSFGTTTFAQTTPGTEYLGPGLTDTDATTELDITLGKMYDNVNDDWANDNGRTWSFSTSDGNLIIKNTDGTIHSQYSPVSGGGNNSYLRQGWIIIKVNKKTSDYDTNGVLFSLDKDYYIQSPGTTRTPTGDGQLDTITAGPYDIFPIPSGASQQATFSTEDNVDFDTTIANIPKHTMLFTNLKFNDTNLSYIKDYFRYNEVYNGAETTRTKIINDTENFYVNMDCGWTDDSYLSVNGTTIDTNTTGTRGAVLPYMYHSGQMGKDDSNSGGSEAKNGVIFPRMKKIRDPPQHFPENPSDIEQRIRVFTRWQDGWVDRGIYENRTNVPFVYADVLAEDEFKANYKDLYNRCVNENIGVFPFKQHSSNNLFMAFEVYQDYTGEEQASRLYKQQSLTMFGFSPMLLDHNYITPMNNDAPAVKEDDYNYTGRREDQANNLNIGAINPTFNYNESLNKFEISLFHTPLNFNLITGNTDQSSQPYFTIQSKSSIFEDYILQPNTINNGDFVIKSNEIFDSQAGIFVNNIYFTQRGQQTEMTLSNYYQSCLWRMGWSYYQWKPINFADNSFANRFNNYSYNSLKNTRIRQTACRPFTTNALTTIAAMPSLNIITDNSGTQGTQNTNSGTPFYQLGYSNNRAAAIIAVSDKLVAKSLAVNMKSPFYRIVCPDLPLDTLIYTAQGGRLNSVGVALLNYSSANMFFYSYASSYNATITRDVTINSLNTQIVDDTGNLVKSLDDRCSITLKIVTPIPQVEEKSPEEEELEDIEEDLEKINETLEGQEGRGGIGVGVGEAGAEGDRDDEFERLTQMYSAPQVQQQVAQIPAQQQEDINQFIENFQVDVIINLIGRTIVSATDDQKDIYRKVANGLAEFFLNKEVIKGYNDAIKNIEKDGLENALNDPSMKAFADDINKFYINEDGRALKGRKAIPQLVDITPDGALSLYNEIAQSISENQDIKEGELSANLLQTIENVFGTGDIRIVKEEDIPIAEEAAVDGKDEGDIDLDNYFEIEKQERRGISKGAKTELNKLFLNYNLQQYLKLYAKMTDGDISDIFKSKNIDELNEYFKDVKKFILKDNAFGVSQSIKRMNEVLKVELGEKYDNYSALLENFTNPQGITGTQTAKERKRERRTKQQAFETRRMGEEEIRSREMQKKFINTLFERAVGQLKAAIKLTGRGETQLREALKQYKDDIKNNRRPRITPAELYRDKLVSEGKIEKRSDINKIPEYRKEYNRLRVAYAQAAGYLYGGKKSRVKQIYQSPVGFETPKPEKRGRGRPRKGETGGASKDEPSSPVRKLDIRTFFKAGDVETKDSKK